MSPVQLPRQLKTLDDLLAQAEHYANYSMRNIGRVPQTKAVILIFAVLFQAACFANAAPPPGGHNDTGSLRQLIPPATVTGGRITGEGKDRKAELVVRSDSDRGIIDMVVEVLFLREDGSIRSSVPHTGGSFNRLHRNESFTVKVGKMFIKDDMTAVDGRISSITFDDKSTWPPMPVPPPEKKADDPVTIKLIGVLGAGDRAWPVVACFNYGSKPVQGVMYQVDYLDADGKVLKSASHGHARAGSPSMESGAGKVISGGEGPPKAATTGQARVTNVKFSDGSEWKPSE